MSDSEILDLGTQVLRAEAQAVNSLLSRLDDGFVAAVRLILESTGHVVVTGMGKSGLVGMKISATLASTGTPSHFLHPAEAIHGDLGRVMERDVVLALSNSGETREVLELIPALKKQQVTLLAITGREDSTLARQADALLCIGRVEEACPIRMAPSASTTAMLALGDALALTVSDQRKFTQEDFARFHPGGKLGRQLMTVREIMRTGDAVAMVSEDERLLELLDAITRARAGAAMVVDRDGRLSGIFTDGDLRRHCARGGQFTTLARDLMTRDPHFIAPDRLASEALGRMKEYRIDELPVVDADRRPVGMVDIQDLVAADV